MLSGVEQGRYGVPGVGMEGVWEDMLRDMEGAQGCLQVAL